MADNAYFAGNPTRLDISRSRMTANPRWTGNWNVGELVPIFARQVLPGETMSMSVASAVRMITPVVPVMDDMDITIEAYYVPNRLLLSRRTMSPTLDDAQYSWQAFIGAQDSVLNVNAASLTDEKLPSVVVDSAHGGAYVFGSLADNLGFPPAQGSGAVAYHVNPLKPLAYYSIWNEYWREPNCQSPVTFVINGGSVNFTGTDANIASSTPYISRIPLANVSRYHGYFGSCLPYPQRNSQQVQLPLGQNAPIVTGSTNLSSTVISGSSPLKWGIISTGNVNQSSGPLGADSSGKTSIGTSSFSGAPVVPANLYADLSSATAASVNQFRLAVQTQRWYEALARSGNKYPDLLAGMFDVIAPNVSTRPEYLGGFTAPIQVSQVAQTADLTQSAGATGNTGLGRVGAFSLSNPAGFLFTKSFTEHGIVMVVMTCRVKESFSQGVNREDLRRKKLDFYWPQFANLGEQPTRQNELYVTGTTSDDTVFGYQEAWAEERMIPDITTGHFRAGGDMEQWTYVNNFASAPTLKGYLNAKNQVDNVDKTIAVGHSTAGFQLFGQFAFDITMVKPMPLYSIPGLVDHH